MNCCWMGHPLGRPLAQHYGVSLIITGITLAKSRRFVRCSGTRTCLSMWAILKRKHPTVLSDRKFIPMKITKTLHVTNRKDWRKWLREHYKTEKEIWLVYYKKDTGKPRILYNDAVEEALCFGWIDSTFKTLDEQRTAQRFSPRKPKSPYSAANKERLRKLIKQHKVIKDVRETLGDI